jgi:hypothetical protein
MGWVVKAAVPPGKRPGTLGIGGTVWVGAGNFALTGNFFSLCTLNVLLFRDCPGFFFSLPFVLTVQHTQ